MPGREGAFALNTSVDPSFELRITSTLPAFWGLKICRLVKWTEKRPFTPATSVGYSMKSSVFFLQWIVQEVEVGNFLFSVPVYRNRNLISMIGNAVFQNAV
jgi:hypothetical protein